MTRSPSPFTAEAVEFGAALPLDTDIFTAVETLLDASASVTPGVDTWLAGGVPALSRGGAWVLPYFWRGSARDAAPPQGAHLRDAAEPWKSKVDSWLAYRNGVPPMSLPPDADSDLPRRYAEELVRTGMRTAHSGSVSERLAVVQVVYGDPSPAPVRALALHVIPRHWVWYDRARKGNRWPVNEMPRTDLSWTWADVVAL